jgi:hypothetical protein
MPALSFSAFVGLALIALLFYGDATLVYRASDGCDTGAAFGCILALVTFGSRVRDWCARTWVDAFLLSARALN